MQFGIQVDWHRFSSFTDGDSGNTRAFDEHLLDHVQNSIKLRIKASLICHRFLAMLANSRLQTRTRLQWGYTVAWGDYKYDRDLTLWPAGRSCLYCEETYKRFYEGFGVKDVAEAIPPQSETLKGPRSEGHTSCYINITRHSE